jgi:hypothetical protein
MNRGFSVRLPVAVTANAKIGSINCCQDGESVSSPIQPMRLAVARAHLGMAAQMIRKQEPVSSKLEISRMTSYCVMRVPESLFGSS